MKSRYALYSTAIFIVLSFMILYFSNSYIQNKEKALLEQKYLNISKNIKNDVKTLIEDKKNATLAFTIAFSKDENIKKALLGKSFNKKNIISLTKELRKETKFKNVWIQLINAEGKSIFRSWANLTKDSLKLRFDVEEMIRKPRVITSISVGKFDMSFKAMIPIFNKNQFIGMVETITHFNSISKILKNQNLDNLIIATKKESKKIKYPFTKNYFKDYYIATIKKDEKLISFLENKNLEELIKIKDYELLENRFISIFNIKENNTILGHIILSLDINNINNQSVKELKTKLFTYTIISIILLAFIIAISYYYISMNKIEKEETKKQFILDSQSNIIVITDGIELINANYQFLKFFDSYTDLDEFRAIHKCICDTFIDLRKDDYIIDKDYNGLNWAEHVLANPKKSFKVAIEKNSSIHHFSLKVSKGDFDEKERFIIVTLTDISKEIEDKNQLKILNNNLEYLVDLKTKELKNLNDNLEIRIKDEIQKSQKKDKLLFQQSKMAALGEMLGNIAHQWRQPLNTITTITSGLKIHKELGILTDESFTESCDKILDSSKYLSQTIDDFRNFFQSDKKVVDFCIETTINDSIKLVQTSLISNNIELIIKSSKNHTLRGFKNEFNQAIINILNNAIDALKNKTKDKRYIFISIEDKKIEIKDNAGGIEDKILEKVFEPYFTTKHQSQGTGIGLYMTQEILVKHMNLQLNVENCNFMYKNNNYKGALFTIYLNQKID